MVTPPYCVAYGGRNSTQVIILPPTQIYVINIKHCRVHLQFIGAG